MVKKEDVEKPTPIEEPPLEKVGQTFIGKLTPQDYWEWRTTFTEVEVERIKQLVAEQKLIVMQKDVEISQLKQRLFFLSAVKDSKDNFDRVKADADSWKKALEGRLGFVMQGCIIDDVTYEVRRLEDIPTGASPTNNNS